MSEPFLGEIRTFGFNFAPQGWAFCDGQILAIQQNSALFALLGTTYGGNGVSTFALPNLQSRVPMHRGRGPGLSEVTQGEEAGVESVTLTTQEIPSHTHGVGVGGAQTSSQPQGNLLAADGAYTSVATGSAAPGFVAQTGGNQPHENRQPYLALNFCIALQGIFPSRG